MKNRKSEKNEEVAIVRCSGYEQKRVDKALNKIFDLIKPEIKKGSKVLIKPNLVMLSSSKKKQEATITNPALIKGVCKILKQKGCKIYIGESSFMDTDKIFKKTGVERICKQYCENKKPLIFEQEKITTIKDKNAKILNEFRIAKIMKDFDYVINMPKLKTHLLTKYTGCVKNFYGLLPGGIKQKLHNNAKGDKEFSNLLVDIYQNFVPDLNIIDGIVSMEGFGPSSGNPIRTYLVLASKNGIALDIAASKIIGLNPKEVNTNKIGIKRKLYSGWDFKLVGVKKLPEFDFRKPPSPSSKKEMLKNIFKQRPIVVDKKKCIKCGTCAERCPAGAITLNPYPVIDKKKCIRCFCCMEVCPEHALSLKE